MADTGAPRCSMQISWSLCNWNCSSCRRLLWLLFISGVLEYAAHQSSAGFNSCTHTHADVGGRGIGAGAPRRDRGLPPAVNRAGGAGHTHAHDGWPTTSPDDPQRTSRLRGPGSSTESIAYRTEQTGTRGTESRGSDVMRRSACPPSAATSQCRPRGTDSGGAGCPGHLAAVAWTQHHTTTPAQKSAGARSLPSAQTQTQNRPGGPSGGCLCSPTDTSSNTSPLGDGPSLPSPGVPWHSATPISGDCPPHGPWRRPPPHTPRPSSATS